MSGSKIKAGSATSRKPCENIWGAYFQKYPIWDIFQEGEKVTESTFK